MAKKNKGHDKQKALMTLRLEFMGVTNMNHATLERLRDMARNLAHPYRSFMGFVIGEGRTKEWDTFIKAKKQGSRKDKQVLNDKPLRNDLHPNEQEVCEILEANHG